MAKRRIAKGVALLSAVGGVAGSTIMPGCGDKEVISGNLMPPPMVSVCFDVTPDTAALSVETYITVNFSDGDCVDIYQGYTTTIRATAEGYQDFEAQEVFTEDATYEINLEPLEANMTEGSSGSDTGNSQ